MRRRSTRSAAGGHRGSLITGTNTCLAGLLQRMDIIMPSLGRAEARPKGISGSRTYFCSTSSFQALCSANNVSGSGRTSNAPKHDALLQPTAPILLRCRSDGRAKIANELTCRPIVGRRCAAPVSGACSSRSAPRSRTGQPGCPSSSDPRPIAAMYKEPSLFRGAIPFDRVRATRHSLRSSRTRNP